MDAEFHFPQLMICFQLDLNSFLVYVNVYLYIFLKCCPSFITGTAEKVNGNWRKIGSITQNFLKQASYRFYLCMPSLARLKSCCFPLTQVERLNPKKHWNNWRNKYPRCSMLLYMQHTKIKSYQKNLYVFVPNFVSLPVLIVINFWYF